MIDVFECSICIEFYSVRKDDCFVTTACGHVFHRHCIEKSISIMGSKCPNCRKATDRKSLTTLQSIEPFRSVKKFNITVIGDSGVGKTSLSKKYTQEMLTDVTTTIGTDFWSKKVFIGEEVVELRIWDTSGQKVFKSICPQYIRESQGVIIAYDMTHATTLFNTRSWLQFANEYAPNAAKILVGCKSELESCDLHDDSWQCVRPTDEETEEVTNSLGLNWYSTSAKNDENVEVVFKALIGQILQSRYLLMEARRANQQHNIITLNAHTEPAEDSFCKKFWTCQWS